MLILIVASVSLKKDSSFNPINCAHCLIPAIVDSPTPTVGTSLDSISIISFVGNSLIKVVAVIQPAEPPPTMTILSVFINFPGNLEKRS